jgi:hypothetical protein
MVEISGSDVSGQSNIALQLAIDWANEMKGYLAPPAQ